jgi:uncharacterized alkaline shock family protein YloU
MNADDRLPCGAAFEDLAGQEARGDGQRLTAHQSGCTYCRTTLEELRRLSGLLQDVAAEDVVMPERIVGRVMHRIGLIFEGGWQTISRTAYGLTRVAAWVITVVAEHAGRSVPGVLRLDAEIGTLSALSPRGESAHDAPVDEDVPGQTRLAITLTASYGRNLPELSDAVRRAVTTDLRRYVGVVVDGIDIEIADVRSR